VCTSPVVLGAWAEGQELHVWGLIYDVADGLARRLAGPINSGCDVGAISGGCDVGEAAAGAAGHDGAGKTAAASVPPAAHANVGLLDSAGDGCGRCVGAADGGGHVALPLNPLAASRRASGVQAPTAAAAARGRAACANSAQLVSAVMRHTAWSAEGEHTTLATAAAAPTKV
jgi:hypothetical protein